MTLLLLKAHPRSRRTGEVQGRVARHILNKNTPDSVYHGYFDIMSLAEYQQSKNAPGAFAKRFCCAERLSMFLHYGVKR